MMEFMIKTLLILWLVGIHAFAFLAMWDTDLPYRIDRKLNLGLLNPPEIGQFHQHTFGAHLQLDGSVEAGSVIFLGDSLTQGLNVAAVTNHGINYGIGMDTSVGLLRRIPGYKSLAEASTIVIAIGINDLLRAKRSPDAILKNYQKIIDRLPSKENPTVKIVLQAVFPVDEKFGFKGMNEEIQEINTMLQVLAKINGYEFINLFEPFVGTQGNLKKEFHIGDGIHLSNNGYQLWIQALKQLILSHSN